MTSEEYFYDNMISLLRFLDSRTMLLRRPQTGNIINITIVIMILLLFSHRTGVVVKNSDIKPIGRFMNNLGNWASCSHTCASLYQAV